MTMSKSFEGRQRHKIRMLAIVVAFGMGSMLSIAAEQRFDIRSQPLGEALKAYAEEINVQLLFAEDEVENLVTQGVSGDFSREGALQEILKNSGLIFEFASNNVLVVRPGSSELSAPEEVEAEGGSMSKFREENKDRMIEEMVVTANKRSASVQNLSMSISALGNEEIERRGLVGMGDYLNSIPGVSVLDQTAGRTQVVMRGLSANPQFDGIHGPTVGVYLGEAPLSGFGILGSNADVKMVDIERVEVLRGPQGTLYGSSTLGGTVRNIPITPNLQNIEGKIKAGYSNTGGFGSENTDFQGVLNIPVIEDTLAIRGVAYRFENSGFYKNVAASDPEASAAAVAFGGKAVERDNIGNDTVTGGRISLLWQPTDNLSVNLLYLDQKIDQDGWPQADLGLGTKTFLQRRLQLRHFEGESGFSGPEFDEMFSDNLDITNLTIEYDLGWGSILSSSSKVNENSQQYRDLGPIFDFAPWSQLIDYYAEAFVQELRFASDLDGPVQFLVGLYYEDRERGLTSIGLFGGDQALNPFGSQITLVDYARQINVKQKAVFGEISYDLTEQVKLTAGFRGYFYDKSYLDVYGESAFYPVANALLVENDESGDNFKFSVDYTPNDDMLLYASWSEGFRLGRPIAANTNPICDQDNDGFYDGSGGVTTGPSQIDSDYVDNFELGGKFSSSDKRLTISADIYRLNWDGIPVTVVFDHCNSTLNAGKARSQGFEFESTYYLYDNLLLNFSTSYVKAELLEDAENLGEAGDRLPGSPKYNASFGLQYEFDVAGHDSYIRSDLSYVGGFYNNLQQSGFEAGNYTTINIRSGVSLDDVSVELFVNNLANDDAITWIDSEGFDSYGKSRANRLRPRTIGINLGYQF